MKEEEIIEEFHSLSEVFVGQMNGLCQIWMEWSRQNPTLARGIITTLLMGYFEASGTTFSDLEKKIEKMMPLVDRIVDGDA